MKNGYKKISCALTALFTAGTLQAALVTHWAFDEASTNTVIHDSVGAVDGAFGSGGTFIPSTAGIAGTGMGNAGDFSAYTGLYVNFGAQSVFSFGTADFTMTGWIKKPETSTSDPYGEVFLNQDGDGGVRFLTYKGSDANGIGRFVFGVDDKSILSDSGIRLDDDEWHWFACVVQSGVMRMYVDGVQQSMTATYAAATTATPTSPAAHLSKHFNGQLDDIRFYDTALSSTLDGNTLNGGALYGIWQSKPALITHWAFDEASTNTIIHDSVGSVDGGFGSGGTFVPSTAGVSGADMGNAGDFSGYTNPYVVFGAQPAFNFGTEDFTMTGWIKIPETLTTDPYGEVFVNKDGDGGINFLTYKGSDSNGIGRLTFNVGNKGILSDSGVRLDDDEWHWFACVVSGRVMSMYVDGVKQVLTAAYDETTTGTPTVPSARLAKNFHGQLDDIRFYRSALIGTLDGNNLVSGDLFDVWYYGAPVSVVSSSIISGNLLKMVVYTPSTLEQSWPETCSDLVLGTWTHIAHSDNGENPFVVTNLDYSTEEGANKAIYVQTTNSAGFFRIFGE